MQARRECPARLTVYLASAPGAGKTRRLLDDAIRLHENGVRILIGWLDTKGRPDLERLAAGLPRLERRKVTLGATTFEDFDLDAALEARPQLLVLDDLMRVNLRGSTYWQDALALRESGIGVVGALNVEHIETVAAAVKTTLGLPARETVPDSFLRDADDVSALDASDDQLGARWNGSSHDDAAARRQFAYDPRTLRLLRELMYRTVNALERPELTPQRISAALAFATGEGDAAILLRKSAAAAHALDLTLDVALVGERDIDSVASLSREVDARVVPLERFDPARPHLADIKATLIAVPCGLLAERITARPAQRDALIVDATTYPPPASGDIAFSRYAQTAADRLRIGYGRLTVYFGAAPGSGTTYAMLDRAQQLQDAGVDVVGAVVDSHGRSETARKAHGLSMLSRPEPLHDGAGELDLAALLARKPAVALVDELAHARGAGEGHRTRYDDVLAAVRAGISVMTTLDVTHLEGLSDAVQRLTGRRMSDTVPDEILELADDVIVIDTTPESLLERFHSGNTAPDNTRHASKNFFSSDTLAALRELALREVVRARGGKRPSPFARMLLGVKARERDVDLIERCARIALRLGSDLSVVHVARTPEAAQTRVVEGLADAARRARARWSVVTDADAARGLMAAMRREHACTVAIEGARRRQHWPRGTPFARRLLDVGAKQLLVLAGLAEHEGSANPWRLRP